ncbi:peroxidase 5-like [Dorcoceras hygrometricum]|nr:peroxidase 5-like [Dorcoceras hygrometricum]
MRQQIAQTSGNNRPAIIARPAARNGQASLKQHPTMARSVSMYRPASVQQPARVAADHRASLGAAAVVTARQGRRIAERMLPPMSRNQCIKDGQRPASRWLFAQPCAGIRALALIPMLENRGGSGSRLPARQRKNKIGLGKVQYNSKSNTIRTIHRVFSLITLLATRAWLQPELQERRLFTVGCGRFVNQVHDRKRSPSDQPALED